MSAMAIGANGGLLRAVLNCAAVNAVLVGDERLCALAVRLHKKLLPVAAAAGGGDVGVVDGRLGIARALNLVNVAVAIFATGGNFSALVDFRVHAVRIGLAGIGVALRAAYLLWRGIVDETFYVLVAIHTGEQAAVNGMLEFVLIDVEADGLAVYFRGQCGIAMAGEAVGVLELLRGGWGGAGEDENSGEGKGGPADGVHLLRRFRWWRGRSAACHKEV